MKWWTLALCLCFYAVADANLICIENTEKGSTYLIDQCGSKKSKKKKYERPFWPCD